jgi:enhanced filamentous growth protein 1
VIGPGVHPQHGYSSQNTSNQTYPAEQRQFDTTGQVCPPGVKPRVTATLWEDEGSLCFQVETGGMCVARREGMSAVLPVPRVYIYTDRSPRQSHDQWHKTVECCRYDSWPEGWDPQERKDTARCQDWPHASEGRLVRSETEPVGGICAEALPRIPFERALEFANREKITEKLYPLFVNNISALLYHPQSTNRTNIMLNNTQHRKFNDKPQKALPAPPNTQPPSLFPSNSVNGGQMPSQVAQSQAIVPHPGRPVLDRAHTFPTPPTSASSLMGGTNHPYWDNSGLSGSMQNSQPLAIDTGLSNARSLPSTPATTPPANALQGLQSYPAQQQSYDGSRSMYSAAPQQQSQYSMHQSVAQQNLARFGLPMQSSMYTKGEMGPPARAIGPGSDGEHGDVKQDAYVTGQANDQVNHGTVEEVTEHEADAGFSHDGDAAAYGSNRASFAYPSNPPAGSLGGEHGHGHLPPDNENGSPHQNGSGRATPRTIATPSAQWPGFKPSPAGGSLYNTVGDARNGASATDAYAQSPHTPSAMNGSMPIKRQREDDDDEYRPGDDDGLKRRKSGREGSVGGNPGYDRNGQQAVNRIRSTIIQRRR